MTHRGSSTTSFNARAKALRGTIGGRGTGKEAFGVKGFKRLNLSQIKNYLKAESRGRKNDAITKAHKEATE